LRRRHLRRESAGSGAPPGGGTPAGPHRGGAAPTAPGPLEQARAAAEARQHRAEHRGTAVAFLVATAIGVLLVVLQPGPKPERVEVVAPPPSTTTSTTIPVGFQLCVLARQFVKDAEGATPDDVARNAEAFFARTVKLVEADLRPDFDALLRYYTEFNDIGAEFDYDLQRITDAGRGDRWAQLLYHAPAGVEVAERTIAERCQVAIPAPPTVITEPPTTFTIPPRRTEAGP
jgi:hypothetical protein